GPRGTGRVVSAGLIAAGECVVPTAIDVGGARPPVRRAAVALALARRTARQVARVGRHAEIDLAGEGEHCLLERAFGVVQAARDEAAGVELVAGCVLVALRGVVRGRRGAG